MVVTKADVYEKVIFADRPLCPHCGKEMNISECADTGLSCGSGWGTPYLFICFNDKCPAFVNGWETMKKDYGRKCSYRCISFPNSQNTEMMMVSSYADGKADIIDDEVIAADRDRGTAADPAVQELVGCFESKDLKALLSNLLDQRVYYKLRLKSAELIGELGLVEAIEPLRSHKFNDQRIVTKVRDAIKRIHEIAGTQECPYCCEVIDRHATICSECARDLSTAITGRSARQSL